MNVFSCLMGAPAVDEPAESDEQSCQVQGFHNISWSMRTLRNTTDACWWLMGDGVHEHTTCLLVKWLFRLQLPKENPTEQTGGLLLLVTACCNSQQWWRRWGSGQGVGTLFSSSWNNLRLKLDYYFLSIKLFLTYFVKMYCLRENHDPFLVLMFGTKNINKVFWISDFLIVQEIYPHFKH